MLHTGFPAQPAHYPVRGSTTLKARKLRLKDLLSPAQDLTANERQILFLAKASDSQARV